MKQIHTTLCLVATLDSSSVAYWYLDKVTGAQPIPGREARAPKPMIGHEDIHL